MTVASRPSKLWKLAVEPEKPKKTAKKRRCLRCRRLFESSGPGNRLCRRCRDTIARWNTDGMDQLLLSTGRRKNITSSL